MTKTIKSRRLTTMSLFCGLGGEHLGKTLAFAEMGIPFDRCRFYALNHWEIAVDTLQRNFPHALTYCEGIETVDAKTLGIPRVDILWASPSCTHHSNARGGKPRDDQQRAHATEVYERWMQIADVPVFMMENVPEFLTWGPLDEYGKPVKEKKGEYFREFVQKLEKQGYQVQWKILCAADYGDPTTRKRLFLQAVNDGKGIHWPKPTHQCPGSTGSLPTWKCAAEHVIDWSIPGTSIFYRKRPLVEKTILRIKHGLKKYGLADYFLYRRSGITICKPGNLMPFLTAYHGGNDSNRRVFSADSMIPTLDCSNRFSLVHPFIRKGYGGNYNGAGSPIHLPLPTITQQDHNFLIEPFVCIARGTSKSGGINFPVSTITNGKHHSLIGPYVVRTAHTKAGPMRAESAFYPLSTITLKNDFHLIQPYIVKANHTHAGEKRVESLLNPISTLTTKREHRLIQQFLVEYYGSSNSQSVQSPLPTTTTKDRFGLIQLITNHDESVDRLPIVLTPEDIDAHDFSKPFRIEVDGETPVVEITQRMFEPHELARAMGFPESFRFETVGGKSLSKEASVKMIGNACPVNTVKELVKAVIQARPREFGLKGEK